MTEAERDQHDSYFFAVACLREQLVAQRKLMPKEMAERVSTLSPHSDARYACEPGQQQTGDAVL